MCWWTALRSCRFRFRRSPRRLLTGDAYVFDHGDLAIAQRASMAVPGLFEPRWSWTAAYWWMAAWRASCRWKTCRAQRLRRW